MTTINIVEQLKKEIEGKDKVIEELLQQLAEKSALCSLLQSKLDCFQDNPMYQDISAWDPSHLEFQYETKISALQDFIRDLLRERYHQNHRIEILSRSIHYSKMEGALPENEVKRQREEFEQQQNQIQSIYQTKRKLLDKLKGHQSSPKPGNVTEDDLNNFNNE